MGSNPRQSRFRPVSSERGARVVIIPIELNLAQLTLKQRLACRSQPFQADAGVLGGAFMLNFEPVVEGA